MRVIVCYPIKSLVKMFFPTDCEVLTVENITELAVHASAFLPEAVVLFSEMLEQPPWEWFDQISAFLPQEVMKVIIPLHRDEELMNRIVETKNAKNTYVLPAHLSNEEIRVRLEHLFGTRASSSFTSDPEAHNGKINTLISYGAAGVTTFSINYPAVLASQLPDSTICVIDFNLEKPDFTEFFQLKEHQLAFLRPYLLDAEKAESQNWKSVFKRNESLPNLFVSTGAMKWKGYEISSLFQALRKQFDYIFIDWGFCFREPEVLQQLLIMSDNVFLFVRPDPFNLDSSRKWLMRWKDTKISFQLVVSHYHDNEVSIARIQSLMRSPIYGVVPRIPYSRLIYSLQSKSILVQEIFPPKQYVTCLKTMAFEEVKKRKEEVLST